jgi:hypothetical protein
MKTQPKITLEDIKVKSFLTSDQREVKAGINTHGTIHCCTNTLCSEVICTLEVCSQYPTGCIICQP